MSTPFVDRRVVSNLGIVAGAAILWRRTARAGAMMLAILYSVFALLWVPQILGSPKVYDVWGVSLRNFRW
jgi:hypothetical protein